MSPIIVLLQVLLAAGIVNVWLLRAGRSTAFRPEGAESLADEFRRYGLPSWMFGFVGTLKLGAAILLLVGIARPEFVPVAAWLLAGLMAGAIVSHVRIGDPPLKAAPATAMMALAIVNVAFDDPLFGE